MDAMNYRPLGRTGLVVSEIGFGAWGIGGWGEGQLSYGPVSESQALEALETALDLGINFFDTSPLYGLGRSERLLGKAIKSRREEVVVASKVGLEDYTKQPDYSPAAVHRSVAASQEPHESYKNEMHQIQDPKIKYLRQHPDLLELLESLRKTGRIRCYGISVRSPEDGVAAILELQFPSVQVNFNMLDQRAIECGLFEVAKRNGTGIIVRTPLCFGFLAGQLGEGVEFPANDHRSRWEQAQIDRWVRGARTVLDAAREAGESGDDSVLALRYCLSFDAVSTVIPGSLNRCQSQTNASASTAGGLSSNACERVREVYQGIRIFEKS